jgi:hypothetical protein
MVKGFGLVVGLWDVPVPMLITWKLDNGGAKNGFCTSNVVLGCPAPGKIKRYNARKHRRHRLLADVLFRICVDWCGCGC